MNVVKINRQELKNEMPNWVLKSDCDCDRREWIRNKMISEFIKKLDSYSQEVGLPENIMIEMSK
jgi:hypothetical protein